MPQLALGAVLVVAGFLFLLTSQRGHPGTARAAGSGRTRAQSRVVPRVRRKLRRAFARGRRHAGASAAARPAGATWGVWRRLALPLAFLAALGSGYAIGKSDLPSVTRAVAGAAATETPSTATAQAPPRSAAAQATITPAPGDRADCAAIHGSDYRSESERAWYLASCHELSGVTATIWTIPEVYCRQGLAFTPVAIGVESSLDASAQGRTFCLDDSLLLGREGVTAGGPFGCPGGRKPRPIGSSLAIGGQTVGLTEVICVT